jgi:hypothetical protein
MTFTDTAAAMRRLADCIDRIVKQQGKDVDTGQPKPMLEDAAAAGAATILCYIRDLITNSSREFDRPSVLVLLERISCDSEIFPCGVAKIMWQAEEDEEERE